MNDRRTVIGERVLKRIDGGSDVTVKLFLPVPDHPGGFRCHYQICGIGEDKVRYAGGVDAIQAIQIAMQLIGADLYIRHKDVKLVFGDVIDDGNPEIYGDPYDLGFPRP